MSNRGTDLMMLFPGMIMASASPNDPPVGSGWLACNGGAYSRATLAALFAALTFTQAGATTTGNVNITALADTSRMFVGMKLEGVGIPAGATVATIVSGSAITISANATATGGATFRFYPHGNGDGATTFNIPDYRGRSPLGSGSGSSLSARVVGQTGGEETHQLQTGELPSHTHGMTALHTNQPSNASTGTAIATAGGTAPAATTDAAGGGGAHNTMHPFAVARFIIKT